MLQAFRVAVAFLSPDTGTPGTGASAGKRRLSPADSTGDIVIDLTADETDVSSHDLELLRASLLLKVIAFDL
jgi:hypothetical protein